MDVDAEVAAANRRVQALIDRRATEALARIEGITLDEYRQRLQKEAFDKALQTTRQLADAIVGLQEVFVAAMDSVAEGFRSFMGLDR